MEGRKISAKRLSTITEAFNEWCPILMAMGQSYQEFWEGDPAISNFYIKAHELRMKQRNEWLAHEYRYNFISTARAISIAMSKDAETLMPKIEQMAYIENPLPLTDADVEYYKSERMRANYERMRQGFKDKAKEKGAN